MPQTKINLDDSVSKTEICKQCNKDMKKCNCDHITAMTPNYRNSSSMSYYSIGDGCYRKKNEVID